MEQCAVVIIDYKPSLDEHEKLSLEQCSKVLPDLDIYLVTSKENDLSAHIAAIAREEQLFILRFPHRFFTSIQAYNRLLKSLRFYESFIGYEYVLIYHTDSFVFRNEVDYWCNKGYDYIGAPIYRFDGSPSPPREDYICVGNGGFSLHKISSAIKVLTTFKRIYPIEALREWYAQYSVRGKLYYLPYFLRTLVGLSGNSHFALNHLRLNEDIFWGKYVPEAFPDFKVAPYDESYKFSMEYNYEYLFDLNERKLPFGCHRWFKPGFLDFWSEKIDRHRVK